MLDFKYKVIFFVLLILSFLILLSGKAWHDQKSFRDYRASLLFPTYIDKTIPDIDIIDVNGEKISREDLLSGRSILHFWATWCKSCEQELYSISRLKRDGLKIYCISIDESKSDAIEYLKTRGIDIPLYFDVDHKTANRLGSYKFPETYLIKNGRIVLKFEGPRDWDNKTLLDFIMEKL